MADRVTISNGSAQAKVDADSVDFWVSRGFVVRDSKPVEKKTTARRKAAVKDEAPVKDGDE